jgi:hypothetical protein
MRAAELRSAGPAVLRPCQHEKLARGAQDEEYAMSQKLNAAIAVIGIGPRHFYWLVVSAARTVSAMGLRENQRANARVSAGAPSNCTCPVCNTSDHAHRPSQTR